MQQVLQSLPPTLAHIGTDLMALVILVEALYIPHHGRRDLATAYIGVNVGVLAVTLLLSMDDNVGAGLSPGLFGVLSIICLYSSSLAQGEVVYFFVALTLGLFGGIKSHPIVVAILMALILASLQVGDHPALIRRNRNRIITLGRAISDGSELITELEDLLDAHVHSVDLRNLNLVNDTTTVKVHYQLRLCSRTARPVQPPVVRPQQEGAHQSLHLVRETPPQAPVQAAARVQPADQQLWPETPVADSAAKATTAPPRYDWITSYRQQQAPASQRHIQATPPPIAQPRYD